MQCNAQSVELEFRNVLDGKTSSQFANASIPGGQLVGGVCIIQAEHGAGVVHFFETLGRLASDSLGGRVGGQELGMLGFDSLELVHQRVVFGIGDLRCVEDVVEMFVVAQLGAEFFCAAGWG